jgi:hypothetical protein
MGKSKKTVILLTLFTALTLMSLLTVYVANQTPTQETTTTTLCTYESTAQYDYTAMLAPNTVYNNKTTLKPNDGILYVAITNQINLTLTYTFQATLPVEATITYSLAETLTTASWSWQTATAAQETTNQTQVQMTIPPFDKDALEAMKATIESETGTSSPTYSLQITPTFTVNANTTDGPISQVFTPTLTISSGQTDQGNVFTVGDLEQTKTGSITEDQTTTRPDAMNERYASYILITISIGGLGLSTYLYNNARPKTEPTPEKPQLEKLIAPHKNLIVDAQEPLKLPREAIIINVENIKELAKIAEILAKPIILTRKPTTRFTIMDQNTVYQYKPNLDQLHHFSRSLSSSILSG